MPTLQKVRQRQTVKTKTDTQAATTQITTKTTTEISQQQAMEHAQILLHGSISTILYLRELLPDTCFDEQPFNLANEEWTYCQYAKANEEKDSEPRSRGMRYFKAMRKGRKENATAFVEDLERGVFETLKRKWLRALQINISADQRMDVLESYTYTAEYESTENGKLLSGLSIRDSQQESHSVAPSVADVKLALQNFIRTLAEACGSMPLLPRNRHIEMIVTFTDDVDPRYRLKGWEADEDDLVFRAKHSDWAMETRGPFLWDAHYLGFGLNFSHLVQTRATASDGSENSRIPSDLIFTVGTTSKVDIDESLKERFAEQRSHQVADPPVPDKPVPVATFAHAQPIEVCSKDNEPYSTDPDTQASSQAREDYAIRQRLHKMLEPSPQLDSEETQRSVPLSACAMALDSVASLPQLRLSDNTMKELNKQKNKLTANVNSDEQHVKCECGSREEDGDMIHCEFCGNWQHLMCYGYFGSTDSRTPATQACYTCLLSEKEARVLLALSPLIALRRGVNVIIYEGYNNAPSLAKQLQCSSAVATGISGQLKKSGFLVATPGSHKKSSTTPSTPKFSMVTDHVKHREMMDAIFNPTTKIAHHFQISPILTNTAMTQMPLPPRNRGANIKGSSESLSIEDLNIMTSTVRPATSQGRNSTKRVDVVQPISSAQFPVRSANQADLRHELRPTRSKRSRAVDDEEESLQASNGSNRVKRFRSTRLNVAESPTPTPGPESDDRY